MTTTMVGDMIKMPRGNVKYIMIHNTGTKLSDGFGFLACRHQHVEVRKFQDIGYHFFIDQEGTIHKGRPTSKTGRHCKEYNNCSIAVCLEGGKDEDGSWADTMNIRQSVALDTLILTLHKKFPMVEVVGHCDLHPKHQDPCFDVRSTYTKEWLDQ